MSPGGLPANIRELLLSPGEPGQIYRQCLELMQREGVSADYALTEQVVYGCEVRYAVQVLEGQIPELYNFGDLDGHGTALLWRVLDGARRRRVAMIGSGPYPVTALLIRQRYPDSESGCVAIERLGIALEQPRQCFAGIEAGLQLPAPLLNLRLDLHLPLRAWLGPFLSNPAKFIF